MSQINVYSNVPLNQDNNNHADQRHPKNPTTSNQISP